MNAPAVVPHDDNAWDVTKDVVRSRLAAMVALTGQSASPVLTFDPTRSLLPHISADAASPAMYHGAADEVAVNLHLMFGAQPAADDVVRGAAFADLLDGYLLHELGHRRDYPVMRWFNKATVPAVLTLPTLGVIGVTKLCGADELVMNWTLAAWGTVWVLWVVALWPMLRWQERRADDYILDSGGGRERCAAFMDSLQYLEQNAPVSAPIPVHASAKRRRGRQARRWRRLAEPS